jgi:hypothetical protein
MTESNTPEPTPVDSDVDEDCYMDGPYVVFTAAFHLKRGFCCGSKCRHCPYGEAPQVEAESMD